MRMPRHRWMHVEAIKALVQLGANRQLPHTGSPLVRCGRRVLHIYITSRGSLAGGLPLQRTVRPTEPRAESRQLVAARELTAAVAPAMNLRTPRLRLRYSGEGTSRDAGCA